MYNGSTDSRQTSPAELNRYVELTTWIRELSSPQMSEYENAEEYRLKLLRNFTRIGELARLNNEILDKYYLPVIDSDNPLDSTTVETMRSFAQNLLDAYSLENLDIPMMFRQAEKLLKDAEEKDDQVMLIHALDDMVAASYTMMYVTQRLSPYFAISNRYRDVGAKAALRLLDYIRPEAFDTLPDDECREIVLINARYIISLFDRRDRLGDQELNAADFQMMRDSLALADEPFYRERAPRYDWRYHTFRTLEYIANMPEMNNLRGFSAPLLKEIHADTVRLKELWESDPAYFGEFCPQEVLELYLDRAAYLAGMTTTENYKTQLIALTARRRENDFSMHANIINLSVPIEYTMLLQGKPLTAQDETFLRDFYHRLPGYVYHMPKKGALSFMLSYLSDILHHYVPVPGGVDFETLILELMAALHPPTYVHTLSVADIAAFITSTLVVRQPELFVNLPGYEDVRAVRTHGAEITRFVRHAALMHDIGKLFIVETIITYGRRLFSEEFRLIEAHPTVGAYLLELFPETAPYADIARGHHKWYDDSAGYPESFELAKSPYRTVVEIVAVADCMDASTDAIGRSYKSGKTLEDFVEELEAGRGTRYAPYLVDLLTEDGVLEGARALLKSSRNENYRKAYHVLEGL